MEDYSLIILAGGRGRRFGGADKGLLELDGKPLVQHLAERFAGQEIIISANRHQTDYQQWADRVVGDQRADFAGPLAGIEAALKIARRQPLLIIPCDMPYLPAELATRLPGALKHASDIAVAHDGERRQPLCLALYGHAWQDNLSRYLDLGKRSVHGWLEDKPVISVNFGNTAAFRNINETRDLRGK